MIKQNNPVSMSEALEFLDGESLLGSQSKPFIEKFAEIKTEKAKELREKLRDTGILKLNEFHISKVIDLMPENKENINKIFVDVSLNEEESKKILDVVKEYR